MPSRLIPPTHPVPFEVRRISTAGTVRMLNGQPLLTHALNGEMIELESVRDCLWQVLSYNSRLSRVDEQTHTITGAPSLKKDGERCHRAKCHLSPRLF